MESDLTAHIAHGEGQISIHALLMESDLDVTLVFWSASLFQSTLSSWRATCCVPGPIFGPIISIHALLMESDARQVAAGPLLVRFQSTLSSWRATRIPAFLPPLMTYFNPRSPHGERHAMQEGWHRMQIFQSTLSSWRATAATLDGMQEAWISIHALLMESDLRPSTFRTVRVNFNPRSPHGERLSGPLELILII